MGVDGEDGAGCDQQGQAIGLGVPGHIHRNAPAGTRTVVHHHGGAQFGLQILRQLAGHKIGRTTGGKAHHQTHHIGLCPGRGCQRQGGWQCSSGQELATRKHIEYPLDF